MQKGELFSPLQKFVEKPTRKGDTEGRGYNLWPVGKGVIVNKEGQGRTIRSPKPEGIEELLETPYTGCWENKAKKYLS